MARSALATTMTVPNDNQSAPRTARTAETADDGDGSTPLADDSRAPPEADARTLRRPGPPLPLPPSLLPPEPATPPPLHQRLPRLRIRIVPYRPHNDTAATTPPPWVAAAAEARQRRRQRRPWWESNSDDEEEEGEMRSERTAFPPFA
ncbi:ORFL131W.iORF2 [Human betaherpesvirus 5]|nr:ORFL131W.iORF2 [Human betaherpesvirus 5]QHX40457.1 ORFL131W.iORF2 [Human betaherpesvirus 5]